VKQFLIIIALMAACAAWAQTSDKQLERGKKLYVIKCAKCHELHKPAAYKKADWDKWMEKMRKKSKLNDQDFEAIKSYTETLR
jgi:cytochrome c5